MSSKFIKEMEIETAYLIMEEYLAWKKRTGCVQMKPYQEDARNIVCYDLFKKNMSIGKSVDALIERYHIHRNTAYRWMGIAMKLLAKDMKEITSEYWTIQISRLEKLYDRCIEEKNVKDSLKVLEMINRLNALYIDKVEITDSNNKFTFGE